MTEEKNSKSESNEEQPELDKEQYKFLKECAEKGPEGIKEWNKWRDERPDEQILLQGADLKFANLQGAKFVLAELQGAKLQKANLQWADLWGAELQGAKLFRTKLQGAFLHYAKLQEADLVEAKLQGAILHEAKLQGANLRKANLQCADIRAADLEEADLRGAELQGARFRGVIVNGSTNFFGCKIDKDTDFRDTGLDNTRIGSGTKILLKYNIRRMNWRDWYKEHKRLKWLVKPFWWMSDYGRSTGRILLTFFILALFFAAVYSNLACWWDIQAIGGSGAGFAVKPHLPLWHYGALIFLRPIYFSVVTMTTLGFGDMFANAQSIWGHILLTLQVILGYVLLGALVTRLAVLFTSDGPAGSFTPMDKETKELLAKSKEDV